MKAIRLKYTLSFQEFTARPQFSSAEKKGKYLQKKNTEKNVIENTR